MDLRPSKDEYFLIKAWATARRSTCVRRSVGCVLVNGLGHDIGNGYNGRPAGLPHCNDVNSTYMYERKSNEELYPSACKDAFVPSGAKPASCEAVHAEVNAWNQCYDRLWVVTAYITRSPCLPCTKMLMNTSCTRIVFATHSSDAAISRELWLRPNPHLTLHGKHREWLCIPIQNPFVSALDKLSALPQLTKPGDV